ncbi:pentatricopeptide repeat-containing protein At1g20230-like [Neltuma alba]|uniref:pentatricopeptide repeat-containing protein At1g20230-like n=1 Tax=Neltuma alba TaxID=207710 RepID=UPI0010A3CB57|nr:pentatricopeptide repeat-containing protein At1g20230-like [Prosopis alba]
MKSAENLFNTAPLRDIISWNTLITGFAQNGHGLDNEGLELKDMMEKQYGLKPRLDHYAILIDLLGRKNRFEEALDLIERTPDATDHIAIWGALLAACRVHGNLDLASRSAEALFKHEPENTARYVMLSNIYAALGRWNDANRIKRIMKEKGLKKEAGCSWIELRNTRHEFRAKDKCHGQIVEICGIISNLVHNMKDVGYQYHNSCHSLPGE